MSEITTETFPLHAGAKSAYTWAGVLTCILIITLPLGIWFIIRGRSGKVLVTPKGLTASALGTLSVEYDEVDRVGVCKIPIVAGGLGGMLARRKVGGAHGVNLCVKTKAGKTKKFVVSMYEGWPRIIDDFVHRTGKPLEDLAVGALGPKWP